MKKYETCENYKIVKYLYFEIKPHKKTIEILNLAIYLSNKLYKQKYHKYMCDLPFVKYQKNILIVQSNNFFYWQNKYKIYKLNINDVTAKELNQIQNICQTVIHYINNNGTKYKHTKEYLTDKYKKIINSLTIPTMQ